MRKRVGLVVVFVLTTAIVFGLQVDKDELNKGLGHDIQFTNYVGPHTKIDTIAEITGIGNALGAEVSATTSGTFSYFGKYAVIHAVSNDEPDKLAADIFVIDKTAEVDNVANVIRMVAGFLQSAYAYSPEDAATLARFVVYYNAVYRGDMAYLSSTYKSVVMKNVDASNAGIATVYTDWPGKTRMLIPLNSGAGKGNLGSVGAGQLSSPKVVENLQQNQPDKGVPERKDITELQQRGIEQSQAQVEQQKQQIASDQKALAEQQQQVSQAQSQLEQQKAAAGSNPTPEQQQSIDAQSKAVAQQQAQVAGQQQKIAQEQQSVASQEKSIAQQQAQVQQERSSIASDQRTLLQQSPESAQTTSAAASAAPGQTLFVYDWEGSGDHLGQLVMIDGVSGKLLARSALNTIWNRRYVTVGKAVVVIAGRSGRGGTIGLVALDPTTLGVLAQGDTTVSPNGGLVTDGTSVYAVIEKNNTDYLGRFTADMKLAATSVVAVDPYSYIAVNGNEVYVQDTQGNIQIVDKTDLTEKKRSGGS